MPSSSWGIEEEKNFCNLCTSVQIGTRSRQSTCIILDRKKNVNKRDRIGKGNDCRIVSIVLNCVGNCRSYSYQKERQRLHNTQIRCTHILSVVLNYSLEVVQETPGVVPPDIGPVSHRPFHLLKVPTVVLHSESIF